MTNEQIDRFLDIVERAVKLGEKWYERNYPEQETVDAEVWKRGEAKPEPKNREEYDSLPADGPGKFQQLIAKARQGSEA